MMKSGTLQNATTFAIDQIFADKENSKLKRGANIMRSQGGFHIIIGSPRGPKFF